MFVKKRIRVKDENGNWVEKDVYVDKDGNIFTQEQIETIK